VQHAGAAAASKLAAGGDRRLIAKFSSSTDTYPAVKGEFAAMELARRANLEVAPVELTTVLGRDVLLVERFDRHPVDGRRSMVSALTILGLDEMAGRYASYADLAVHIRERFTEPARTLRELFSRITFNVLVGNTDDHARNHVAFWHPDRELLSLTPAYDICPQPRAGGEATQAMAIAASGWRMSQLEGCIRAAPTYLLTVDEAREIADRQITVIREHWDAVAELARMTAADRSLFWGRQFLNPFALETAASRP
jgi:serine/threonine-protein kinase HipA